MGIYCSGVCCTKQRWEASRGFVFSSIRPYRLSVNPQLSYLVPLSVVRYGTNICEFSLLTNPLSPLPPLVLTMWPTQWQRCVHVSPSLSLCPVILTMSPTQCQTCVCVFSARDEVCWPSFPSPAQPHNCQMPADMNAIPDSNGGRCLLPDCWWVPAVGARVGVWGPPPAPSPCPCYLRPSLHPGLVDWTGRIECCCGAVSGGPLS